MGAGYFGESVELGLRIAKRVRMGKDEAAAAPGPAAVMQRTLSLKKSHDPTGPMMYAVISDPEVVDNPDIPSYQPHVYGRCYTPALIPLQMDDVSLDLSCYLDSVFVVLRASWRLHCVSASRSSDCLLVVPMSDQGSILCVEIDVAGVSFSTQIVQIEEMLDMAKLAKDENEWFYSPQIFSFSVPRVHGGSIISVCVKWCQQLSYIDGNFSINVPFTFPEYVTPYIKRSPTRENIQLNVNTGIGTEVLCKTTSHPLKETSRQMGKLGYLYEAKVDMWSCVDFSFSYAIPSNDIFGGLLLQSPSIHDFDQREMFCLYLFPGDTKIRKVFCSEVVFIVDISESMRGRALENVKDALTVCLSNLTPVDSFSIIAFNEEIAAFSSTLELATTETIETATQWISEHCIAMGGTSILPPLSEALKMLSDCDESNPHIFLITDGSVEDERDICQMIKTHTASRRSTSPCISTFGIGPHCNHYFLRTLAHLGRGHYGAAHDADSINTQMQRLFTTASSATLKNISIDVSTVLDSFEVYPFPIPDLSSKCPLMISGRCKGSLPDSVKLNGILADNTNFAIDMKVRTSKDIPLDKVFAKRQIDVLTAQALFSDNKQLEQNVTKISKQTGFASEYTRMVLIQTDNQKHTFELAGIQKGKKTRSKVANMTRLLTKGYPSEPKIRQLRTLTTGFGNVIATKENVPSIKEDKPTNSNVVLNKMTNCCTRMAYCCCPCFMSVCSKINDQCAITLSQLCAALSCFGCISFCMEVCCECDCN